MTIIPIPLKVDRIFSSYLLTVVQVSTGTWSRVHQCLQCTWSPGVELGLRFWTLYVLWTYGKIALYLGAKCEPRMKH